MNGLRRRTFFGLAGTLEAVAPDGFRLSAQQQYPPPVPANRQDRCAGLWPRVGRG